MRLGERSHGFEGLVRFRGASYSEGIMEFLNSWTARIILVLVLAGLVAVYFKVRKSS